MIIYNLKPLPNKINFIRNINIKADSLLSNKLACQPKPFSKLAISNIAMHALTDVYYNKLNVLLKKYLFSYIFINRLPKTYRFYVLITSSVYHIRNDVGIFASLILHIFWFVKPITSVFYLSLIHVPLHYLNAIDNKIPIKYILFLNMMSIILSFINIERFINPEDLCWVWLVLGHIMVVK